MRDIKKERLKRVQEMFSQNMKITDMAKELGCGISTVSGYLKELGIKETRTAVLTQKIKEMYSVGKTISQICFELEVSNTFVRTVLKKCGYRKSHYSKTEIDLINEDKKFAEDRLANLTLEKMLVDGVMYEDVTPILSPR